MKSRTRKYKYAPGVQQIALDTPDYSKAYKLQTEKGAQSQGITQAAGALAGNFKPIADVGSMAGSVIKSNVEGKTGAQVGEAVSMGTAGMAAGVDIGNKFGGAYGAAIGGGLGLVGGGIYGALSGGKEYDKGKRLQKEAERTAGLANANKRFKETSTTDAQSYLAKKGKYKVAAKQPRMIETEGREPIFSPKKPDGTRDLLYYNPNDPTHEEGGVKAMVIPKKGLGTNMLMPKRPASKYSLVGNGMMADGNQKTKVFAPQQKLSHTDSVAHQADKILKYEQLKGGPKGASLPQYSDPKYKQMLMGKIYPEINKIMPNASAMEKGEAMDLVFNSGWDDNSGKITLDPRAYALQEYYRKNDPSKLDSEGNWAGRQAAPYSFDKEYANTIGKLSENDRRIMMNKGRDWFYKNRAPKNSTWNLKTQGPHPNYKDTWYGRIHNTNDFSPFNPNNPMFTPKKAYGAKQLKVDNINDTAFNEHLTGQVPVNAANNFMQPRAGIMQVARNIPEDRRKEKIRTERSHKKSNPDANKIVNPPLSYEMKPPPPRSTFNTKNDFKNGGKSIKVYADGTDGTQAGATYKHTKKFGNRQDFQNALKSHDDSLALHGQSRFFEDAINIGRKYHPTVETLPANKYSRSIVSKGPDPNIDPRPFDYKVGSENNWGDLQAPGFERITSKNIQPIKTNSYTRKESTYKSEKEYNQKKDPNAHAFFYNIDMYKHPEMRPVFEPDTVNPVQGRKAKLSTSSDTVTSRRPVKPVIVPTTPAIKVPTRETPRDTTSTKTTPVVTTNPTVTPARSKFLGKEKTGLQKLAEGFINKVGSSTRMSNGKRVRVAK